MKIQFKPMLWPSIFSILTFAILISFGTWQVKRLFWKETLIQNYLTQSQSNPITDPAELEKSSINEFKSIGILGRFMHSNEIYITGKTYEGNAGFHVITPFIMENNKIVLINRGWVPREKKDPISRIESKYTGSVKLIGIVTPGFKKGFFSPKNDLSKNVWLYVDYTEMSSAVGMELQKFVIDAKENGKGGFPIGSQTRIDIPNDHLQYAVTWYLLGLTLLLVWFFWNKKKDEK